MLTKALNPNILPVLMKSKNQHFIKYIRGFKFEFSNTNLIKLYCLSSDTFQRKKTRVIESLGLLLKTLSNLFLDTFNNKLSEPKAIGK